MVVHGDLWSRLEEDHLNLCTRMYRQDWWTVHNFPYDKALDVWHKGARRYSGQHNLRAGATGAAANFV